MDIFKTDYNNPEFEREESTILKLNKNTIISLPMFLLQ